MNNSKINDYLSVKSSKRASLGDRWRWRKQLGFPASRKSSIINTKSVDESVKHFGGIVCGGDLERIGNNPAESNCSPFLGWQTGPLIRRFSLAGQKRSDGAHNSTFCCGRRDSCNPPLCTGNKESARITHRHCNSYLIRSHLFTIDHHNSED